MYSSSDFEKLWFFYKTEGESQGISINTFCLPHGVPSSDSVLEESPALVCAESALIQSNLGMNSGNILVTIQTRDGLNIRKDNLDYRGLKALVEKLEAYVGDFRFEEFLLSS